jgi:hypothetical protein
MKIEIKNRWNGGIILCGEYESIKDCLEKNIGANLYEANLREADLREANLYGANLRKADLIGADLREANLIGADLRGANLRGADLRKADLIGADLIGANLRKADLIGADLRGAVGITLPIISISGSLHTLQYMAGKIKIGCENHTVEKWLNDYKEIGTRNNYTPKQIAEYGEYIKMCAKFVKEKKK